jgi:hypothetical protein
MLVAMPTAFGGRRSPVEQAMAQTVSLSPTKRDGVRSALLADATVVPVRVGALVAGGGALAQAQRTAVPRAMTQGTARGCGMPVSYAPIAGPVPSHSRLTVRKNLPPRLALTRR